jgi:hypothetical protein
LAYTYPTSPPDKVAIWSSQLAANDFPPVCAMTGAPAETWRKFRFSTAPAWAALFLLLLCTGLGLLIVFLAIYLVSRRATGYLPLTRAASRRVGLASWIPAGLVVGGFVLVLAAATTAGAGSSTTTHVNQALVFTNWVKDANSISGPHPGYKPALTGLSGADIVNATSTVDQSGKDWVVDLTFTPSGALLFDQLTAANVAACPLDSSGAACPERFLTVWLGLQQQDIDSWDDPSVQPKLLAQYPSGCTTADGSCGKLVVDAVTQDEISGGSVEIFGFNQEDANNIANVTTSTVEPVASTIATVLLIFGLLAVIAGIICILLLRRLIGPQATVKEQQPGYSDRIVELRKVHPAFVAAVLQVHQTRSAQYSASQQSQAPPLPPGPTQADDA